MHYFCCPSCNNNDSKHLTSWTVYYPKSIHSGEQQISTSHELTPPCATLNPVLYHHQHNIIKTPTSPKATLTLSINTGTKEAKKALHVVSSIIDLESLDDSTDEKNKENLFNIFRLLHPILVISSQNRFYQQYDRNQINAGSGNEHCDRLFDMAMMDDSSLLKCIFGLATGKNPNDFLLREERRENLAQKKKIIQAFAITEMIRSHSDGNGRRGPLKNFIGKQLMVNCAPQALYRILNYIGISNSNETVRIDGIKDCREKIMKGYSFDGKKYDLFLILFDNLGFRIRGGKNTQVGYEQYTALEIVNVSKNELIDWGVYPNVEKCLPGTMHNFQFHF